MLSFGAEVGGRLCPPHSPQMFRPSYLNGPDEQKINCFLHHRGVVPGGAGGAMAAISDFGRSVNSISTKGGGLCLPNNAGTLIFSDLHTS